MAVGPGKRDKDGAVLPMGVKVHWTRGLALESPRVWHAGVRGLLMRASGPTADPPPYALRRVALLRWTTRCCYRSTAAARSQLTRMISCSSAMTTLWASSRIERTPRSSAPEWRRVVAALRDSTVCRAWRRSHPTLFTAGRRAHWARSASRSAVGPLRNLERTRTMMIPDVRARLARGHDPWVGLANAKTFRSPASSPS